MAADVNLNGHVSNKEGGILARLWRKVIKEANYRHAIPHLISRYTNKNNEMKGQVAHVKRKTKSSLINDITSSDMTFKVLLHLLFNLLYVKNVKITFEITHQNDRVTEHTVIIQSDDYQES